MSCSPPDRMCEIPLAWPIESHNMTGKTRLELCAQHDIQHRTLACNVQTHAPCNAPINVQRAMRHNHAQCHKKQNDVDRTTFGTERRSMHALRRLRFYEGAPRDKDCRLFRLIDTVFGGGVRTRGYREFNWAMCEPSACVHRDSWC